MTTGLDPTSHGIPRLERDAPGRLVVCERSGNWAVALRRELPRAGLRVHETRSVTECWEMLARSRGSFIVAELTRANAQALLDRMLWLPRDFPLARIAVVADRSLASCEWLMREAGAVHFTVSPRQSRPLACLAVRHLDSVPGPQRSLADRIWASLPWAQPSERRPPPSVSY